MYLTYRSFCYLVFVSIFTTCSPSMNQAKKAAKTFCTDIPQPILAVNMKLLFFYSIVVQDDSIFIHNHYSNNGNNKWKDYYLDLNKKELVRVKDSLYIYAGAREPRVEKIWNDKTVSAFYYIYADNIEHKKIKKISYTYQPWGRGGIQNGALTFLDEWSRPISKGLVPYYGNHKVISINTFQDKLIIIAPDLYNHQTYEKTSPGEYVWLYVFNIDDFLGTCKHVVKGSKMLYSDDAIPEYIPKLNPEVVGKVIE